MSTKWLFRLLGVLVFVIIGCLLFCCFFQFPSMDDYVGSFLKKHYGGLQPAISAYLTLGNGRFSTIPLFLYISSSAFWMHHYGIILVFFVLLTFISVFCFVRAFDRRLFNGTLPLQHSLVVAGMMLMVFLTVVPEIASFFFWMATSTTYLISFCVFLFLLISYARGFKWLLATCVLSIIAAGCNEVTLFYSLAIPLVMAFVYIVSRRRVPWQVLLLIALNVLLLILVTQITGLKERADQYTAKQGLAASLAGAVYRTFQSLGPVFTNPLFYVSCFGVYISAGFLNASFLQRISYKKTSWWMECAVIFLTIVGFHFMVRQFGGEVVPLRASNIINCLSVLGIWWVILANANRVYSISWVQANKTMLTKLFLALFCVTLFFSSFTAQLFKNLVAVPVHARVLKQREEAIAGAKNNGRHSVIIRPYAIEAQAVLEQWFPAKKKFLSEEDFLPPSFSYFMDEPVHKDRAHFYAEYYGIDSIITGTDTFIRWSLMDNSDLWH